MKKYRFHFEDTLKFSNALDIELETRSELSDNTIKRFVKSNLKRIGSIICYFGDIKVSVCDEGGKQVADGKIRFNCFAGKDIMSIQLK